MKTPSQLVDLWYRSVGRNAVFLLNIPPDRDGLFAAKDVANLKKFRENLKKGDKIVTTGGIYGKVAEVKDNLVTIDVGGDVRLRVDKSAVLNDASDIEQK